MGHFYFIRHGQTVWNVENKICGATDIPLTEHGISQAEAAGKKLLSLGIKADEILSSPLCRAKETARRISLVTGIPFRVEERLIEQNFGKWESTPRDSREFKEAKKNFIDSYEGGENMLAFAHRIYTVRDERKAASDEKTVIIVAHNGLSRVIESYFRDMTNEEYAAFGIGNCEIRRYDF